MDWVARARTLAMEAHAGQVDKAGHPYIGHVGRVAATVTVDGAWLDLDRRKLTTPPAELSTAFRKLPLYEAPVR